jgi:hypothetical protein
MTLGELGLAERKHVGAVLRWVAVQLAGGDEGLRRRLIGEIATLVPK